jgi:4-hydroxy-tetrahydrodipicolinate synthase
VPVIAGAGSNNTSEAISLTKFAKKAGADAALHITPYYNRPTQEGLFQHFKAIAKEAKFPLVAYNVPGRTGVNLLPETLARMVKHIPEVIAVKEATGSLVQASNVLEQCNGKICLLSGDDFVFLPLLSLGCCGMISVTSNVAPALMAGIYNSFTKGDLNAARKQHFQAEPLNRAMFLETNPIPAKTALGMMGKINPEMRLPLCAPSENTVKTLRDVLGKAKLLPKK